MESEKRRILKESFSVNQSLEGWSSGSGRQEDHWSTAKACLASLKSFGKVSAVFQGLKQRITLGQLGFVLSFYLFSFLPSLACSARQQEVVLRPTEFWRLPRTRGFGTGLRLSLAFEFTSQSLSKLWLLLSCPYLNSKLTEVDLFSLEVFLSG